MKKAILSLAFIPLALSGFAQHLILKQYDALADALITAPDYVRMQYSDTASLQEAPQFLRAEAVHEHTHANTVSSQGITGQRPGSYHSPRARKQKVKMVSPHIAGPAIRSGSPSEVQKKHDMIPQSKY